MWAGMHRRSTINDEYINIIICIIHTYIINNTSKIDFQSSEMSHWRYARSHAHTHALTHAHAHGTRHTHTHKPHSCSKHGTNMLVYTFSSLKKKEKKKCTPNVRGEWSAASPRHGQWTSRSAKSANPCASILVKKKAPDYWLPHTADIVARILTPTLVVLTVQSAIMDR